MTSERRRLVAGTAWTLLATAIGLGVGILLRPVIVFYVGVDGYGIWAAALAIGSLFAIGGDLGVGAALTKVASERRVTGKELGGLPGSALFFGILIGAGTGAVLLVLAGAIERSTNLPGLGVLLTLLALQMPLNLGSSTFLGLMQGERRFRTFSLVTIGHSTAHVAIASFLLASGLGVVSLPTASLVASLSTFVALLILFRRRIGIRSLTAFLGDLRALVPFGVQLSATNGLSMILYNIDLVILSFWTDNARVLGTYALAVFVTRGLWIIPGIINLTTYPAVSEYAAADRRRLSTYLSRALLASIAITGALSTALILFGRPLLRLVFGPDVLPSYEIAILLLPGTAFLGCLRSIASSLPGIGRADVGMKIAGFGAALAALLCILFVPSGQAIGAAVAVSVSLAGVAAILLWSVRRHVLEPIQGALEYRRIAASGGTAGLLAGLALFVSLSDTISLASVAWTTGLWIIGVFALGIVSGGWRSWAGVVLPPRTAESKRGHS